MKKLSVTETQTVTAGGPIIQ